MSDEAMNRLRFESDLPAGYSNKQAKGKLPDPLPKPLFLNLGCGKDVREGFVNIDLFGDHPDIVYMDIRKLQLPDNSADLVLANDVLEHFSHRETDLILKEWNRVLKPGAEIIIRCPSLRLQAKAYLGGKWDADVASLMIFGGQSSPGDYHCIAFDPLSIRKHLEKTGFEMKDIQEYDLPQDKGYINLNMTVKAAKRTEQQELFREEKKKEPQAGSLFEGIDFDDDDDITEVKANSEEDISILEGLVEEKPEEDPKIVEKKTELPPEGKIPALNVVWEGSQFVHHSLALINREQSSNLLKTGLVNLTIVPYEEETFDPGENEKYKVLKENDIRFKPEVDEDKAKLPYVWIRHQWPPKAEPPAGAKWIIMQPWEFSKLRQDFVELFEQADEVWTPSNFSRKSFVESGLDPNKVQVIPNGIDPELFKPYGEKYPLKTDKPFKLLFVGGTTWRKGFDILLDVYSNLFTAEDNITLIVKDMGVGTFYRGQTAEDKINEINANPEKPEIIYLKDDMTEEEIASLYRACDLFVSPYRGEGFSLPVLEAMASGLPVAVTKGGATDDFTLEDFAIYIDSYQKEIGDEIDGQKLAGDAYVLEPNMEHLARILRYVYEKPAITKSIGINASAYARKHWTWNKSTLRIFSRLDNLYGTELGKLASKKLETKEDRYIRLSEAEELYNKNKFNEARDAFEKLDLNDFEKDWQNFICLRLADINIENAQPEKAEKCIENIEEGEPGDTDKTFFEAVIKSREGEHTKSLDILSPLMDNWINTKFNSISGLNLDDILVVTANIMLEEDDLEAANKIFTEALKYNPENPEACYGAGKCFEKAGAKEEAAKMYEWAVKIDPAHTGALDALNGR